MSNKSSLHPVLQPLGNLNVNQDTAYLTNLYFDQMPVSVKLCKNGDIVATWVPHVYCENKPKKWSVQCCLQPHDEWSVQVLPETVQVACETALKPSSDRFSSLESTEQTGIFYHGVVIDLILAKEIDLHNTKLSVTTGKGELVLDDVPLAALERGYCPDTVFWKVDYDAFEGPLQVTLSPPLEDYDVYGLTYIKNEK